MTRLRLALAALASLAPLSACHLVINLDDDDDSTFPIDAAAIDAVAADGPETTSCAVELSCPPPTASNLTVCGRLWDLEDEVAVGASSTSTAACTVPALSGPCAISVRFHDALDFAQNPDGAQEISAGQTYLDHCGRFRAVDLAPPTFGFLAIVTEDAGGPDLHRRTAVVLSNAEARPGTGLFAYVTRHATDTAWSAAVGLTAPPIGDRGIYVPIFLHGDQPVGGVRVTRDSAPIPADDLYFSDPSSTRSILDPARTSTGPNGAAVVLGAPGPIVHAGTGAEPIGCEWPTSLAASIPGTILVERKRARLPGGEPCP